MNKLPRLLIDIDRVKKNIQKMNGKADSNKIEFRPHFKTHQSLEIGELFREVGIEGITVSSMDMASYFANDGWKDITVAFPAPIHQISDINKLNSKCSLKLLLSSKESLIKLNSELDDHVDIYIELNSGQNRSGISIENYDEIEHLGKLISDSDKLNFYGFYCHAGQTYSSKSKHEVEKQAKAALTQIEKIAQRYSGKQFCFGDTPSCSVLEEFGSVTQLSPGNFVFYDWMQFNIGSCEEDEIAVAMECPIVDINHELGQLIIHGGAIHFSKDSIEMDGQKNFGQLISKDFKALHGNYIKALSQEHGIVQCTPDLVNTIQIGDSVVIFPIHSCLTANLMAVYINVDSLKVIDHKQKRCD